MTMCNYVRERGFYLDVFACGVFVTSKNVPGAPARARQCRPTGRRAQGIFGAERPSTRPNGVVVRAAGKTCCMQLPYGQSLRLSVYSRLNKANYLDNWNFKDSSISPLPLVIAC